MGRWASAGTYIDHTVEIISEGWVSTASADNALATATKAAETGKSHYITTIFASYSGAKTGLLQIKDGAAVIAEYYIVNADVISLPTPIKATAGNAVSVELAASGTAGTLGKVNLVGYTA
jgi:hypothetical protein